MLISKKSIFAGIFCLSLLSFLPASAFAEDPKSQEAIIRRETLSQKAVVSTARKADEKKLYDNLKKISFEDILKDPDNPQLNYQYALQQVKENDLLGAMGTLERVLATHPDLHEVRLFYAVVLFRLDNMPEAQREIDTLENAPLNDALRKEWSSYRDQIKLRKKKTRFSLTQANGYAFDTNRNSSPSSKKILFGNILADNTVESRRRSDSSFLNITSLDVTHDLGFQAGHELYGSFTYYLQNQNKIDSLDLGSYQYELGPVYKGRYFNFMPTFSASHVYLSDENYLRTQGGNFLFTRTFKNRLDTFLKYSIEHQDYLRIKENDAATQRTGVKNSVIMGAGYMLTPSMKISGALNYAYKNAKANYEGYDHYGFLVSHSWLLGKGQFLINSIDTSFDRYDEQDAAIATIFRKDSNFRYRVTYGAPLTFFLIGKVLPKPFKNMIASFSYEYFRSLSNITNYTYTNNKFQALLTKRWEF